MAAERIPELDPDRCYGAALTHDRRYDGRIFAGVVTTGVYCRPVCPVRPPKRENVRWFRCAAAAEAAGFRPCRRCRPEAAPGTPAWLGTSAVTVLRRRRHGPRSLDGSGLVLRLPYRPPLDWPRLLAFLGARATPGVEHVAGDVYRRTLEVGDAAGTVDVTPAATDTHLLARIRLGGPAGLLDVVARARRLFDLDVDPRAITARLGRSPLLRARVRRAPGLRLPGAWDPFELAVRAVLGQQVSVRAATTLAGRLARAFGRPLPVADPGGLTHLFPTPAALAGADVERIGLPRARAATIRALATAVARGTLALHAAQGLEDAVARLRAVPGIGAWTAHYVAMRALGEPDAFPAGDLGLRRALGRRGRLPSARRLDALAERWRPWRAYAVIYLWTIDPEVRS